MLKKVIQCKQVIPLIASLLSVAVVPKAEAGTVQLDMMGNIISIQDIQLVEEGVQRPGEDFTFTVTSTYNINFFLGSFNNIFGDPSQPGFDTSCNVGSGSGLCFWENETQATLLVNEISKTLNALEPVPSNVVGTRVNFPPFLDNTRNFYFIPVEFNGVTVITSRQGTNDNTNTWVTAPLTDNAYDAVTMYASAELTSQEFKAEIPESSNLMGVIVTVGLIVLVTRKK